MYVFWAWTKQKWMKHKIWTFKMENGFSTVNERVFGFRRKVSLWTKSTENKVEKLKAENSRKLENLKTSTTFQFKEFFKLIFWPFFRLWSEPRSWKTLNLLGSSKSEQHWMMKIVNRQNREIQANSDHLKCRKIIYVYHHFTCKVNFHFEFKLNFRWKLSPCQKAFN